MTYTFAVTIETDRDLHEKELEEVGAFLAEELDMGGSTDLYEQFPPITEHYVEFYAAFEPQDRLVAKVEITGKGFACDPGWRPKCTE